MAKDLSFESACQIVKSAYPELANDINKFLSIVLTAGTTLAAVPIAAAIGPTILTPAAIILTAVGTLSNLLGVKNEIFAISESIITKVTNKREKDTIKMFERMQQAYTLTCYTSFFEALYRNKELAPLLKKIKMTDEEKCNIAVHAVKDLLGKTNAQTGDTEMDWLNSMIDLPQPGDSFETQRKLLSPLHGLLASRIKVFFELEIIKKQVNESGGLEKIERTLEKVLEKALECFKVQYYGLAMKYPEFAIWLNLQEGERDRIQLQRKMVEYNRKLTELAQNGQKTIDIGFKQMEKVISSIPWQIERRQIDVVLQRLETWYTNTVDQPIIDDPQQVLIYPKKSEIFIPQSFQVLHYTGGEQLELHQTWRDLPARDDLSAFLLSYFNHPTSVRTPLILLGQPGSGKSLLTSMLAARLIAPASSYTPIRIELRHVNTEASIPAQIKDQVYKDTNLERSWGELANCLIDRPPLVLFDGYDELLQATDKLFLGYLKDIEAFQKDELTRGQSPVRTIVTSRISLIDKAVIPKNATIIRLLEFKQQRQCEWIARWNDANSIYFEQAHVEPFALPQDNENIIKLAEQPLLLMMLAIYDSVGNPLVHIKTLDQSLLYNELLRRFIERELKKDEEAARSWQKEELEKAIDREMERLGVAAIGMFNRRRLHIKKEDLGADLKFFELEKSSLEVEGRQLSSIGKHDLLPAEKMFGSFFFQKLTAVRRSTEPGTVDKPPEQDRDVAYEFLHNTFGEFLTADFMLRKILEETAAIHQLTGVKVFRSTLSQKVEQLDGLEPGWFARFMYAPLFSRPVIVSLLREWAQHCLEQEQRDVGEFLTGCDTIVTHHIEFLLTTSALPALMAKSDQRPFADLPIIGYLAIYTLNLLLLRTLLSPDGYTFDESKYAASIDGTRAWDRLTYLWRSWFSLESLNELAVILAAERDKTTIHLKIKKISETSAGGDRLDLIYNVGQTLADNIVAGLSGFLLHDSFRTEKAELDTISKRLHSEQLGEHLAVDIFTKQLHYLGRETEVSLAELDAISKELRFDEHPERPEQDLHAKQRRLWSFNLESSASALAEITRLAQKTNDPEFLEIYHSLVVTPPEVTFDDELTEKAIKLARETNFVGALQFFSDRYLDELLEKKKFSAMLLIELIKSVNVKAIPAISQYIRQEYLEKVQNNQRNIPMPLAIQMIKFAREMGDQAILDYFSQDYIKVVLKSQEDITFELAIEMMKLARETGEQQTLSQLMEKCIGIAEIRTTHIRRHLTGDLQSRQSVALIIELFKAACEVDNQKVAKSLVTYAKLVVAERREYLFPGLAATILKFARKINAQEIKDAFSKNYLSPILQTQEQVLIELSVELIKLAQDQKTYSQASIKSFYHKNITMERFHLESLPLDKIIDIRDLARVFGDDKLARWIDARLGL